MCGLGQSLSGFSILNSIESYQLSARSREGFSSLSSLTSEFPHVSISSEMLIYTSGGSPRICFLDLDPKVCVKKFVCNARE